MIPNFFSPSCNADDYGQMGWPLCSPEEQVAVKCYDDMWKVDVGFNMVKRNKKMSCPVQVFKMIFRSLDDSHRQNSRSSFVRRHE